MILFVAGIYMPRSSYFLCLPPIWKKLNSAASIAMPIPTPRIWPVYAYRFVRLLPRIHNTQDKSLTESKHPSWDTRSFEVAKSITITAKAPLRITQPTTLSTQQIKVRYRRSTSIYVTYVRPVGCCHAHARRNLWKGPIQEEDTWGRCGRCVDIWFVVVRTRVYNFLVAFSCYYF